MAQVTLKNLVKHYDDKQTVIHGVDLDVADGEFVVFVGPSGCGKSTLLRMIAGLETISGGELHIGGRLANDIAPAQRKLAMVFQSYALYPHMTVYENMAFALKLSGQSSAQVQAAVERAAAILQIAPLLKRKPKELSGGQRQRVAISRLHKELKTTMIYVTHDQVEAMTLGQRIVVFNGGRIEQVGTPFELYNNPGNLFVAGFLGTPRMNFIAGTVATLAPDRVGVLLPGGALVAVEAAAGDAALQAGDQVTLGIRAEHIVLRETAPPGGPLGANEIEVCCGHVEYLGDVAIVYSTLADLPHDRAAPAAR